MEELSWWKRWTQPADADLAVPLRGVELVPEAGVFGGPTPSLSDGLCVWQIDDGELHAAVHDTLVTLAAFHRVLVVAPARLELPAVRGGPVYATASRQPSRVGQLLRQLVRRPGRPPAVMLVGQGSDPERYRDLADAIPLDHGGVALVHKPVAAELPTMVGQRHGSGWQVELEGRSLALVMGPHGLMPLEEG